MKLLYVIHQYFPDCFSGTEQYCLAASREARRRGDEVVVLSLDPDPARQDPPLLLYDQPYDGFTVLRLRHWRGLQPNDVLRDYENPHVARLFGSVLDQQQPDAVHFFHLRNLGSDLLDVAVADDTILLAAEGKLIVYDVPTGNSDDKSLADCPAPALVAARPGSPWAAVGCGGGGVVGYHLTNKAWGPYATRAGGGEAGSALALDGGGDVAFLANQSTILVVDLADGRELANWADVFEGPSAAPMIGTGVGHQLLAADEAAIRVIAPYAGDTLCGGGS